MFMEVIRLMMLGCSCLCQDTTCCRFFDTTVSGTMTAVTYLPCISDGDLHRTATTFMPKEINEACQACQWQGHVD